MFLEIQTSTTFGEVPRPCLFVVLVRTAYRGWLWSISGMILTRENSSTGRNTCHIATFFLWHNSPPPPHGPGPSHSRGFKITYNAAPQSVGFLWTSDRLVTETSTWKHSQQTNIHAPGGIWTHNLSRLAAADLRPRPRGHLDRHIATLSTQIPLRLTWDQTQALTVTGRWPTAWDVARPPSHNTFAKITTSDPVRTKQ